MLHVLLNACLDVNKKPFLKCLFHYSPKSLYINFRWPVEIPATLADSLANEVN